MSTYPVLFDVPLPARFDRVQLVLRLLVTVVLGLIGVSLGWVFVLLYFALPAVAAIAIQARGADAYLHETGSAIERLLLWLLSFAAYMSFLGDRFPTGGDALVRFEVRPAGTPTVPSALWRLLASLPEALVLAILACGSGIIAFLSVLSVLFAEKVPPSFLSYQRGVLRWTARLFAYHASLVEPMPPFAFDTATMSNG